MRLILALFLMLPLKASESHSIHNGQHLKNFLLERKKTNLVLGAMYNESCLGKHTVSKSSIKEKAVGILQIRPGMVEYINRNMNKNFSLLDRQDSIKSIEMFFLFQERVNPTFDLDLGLHKWNAGPNNVASRWHLTEKYRKKARTFLKTRNFKS